MREATKEAKGLRAKPDTEIGFPEVSKNERPKGIPRVEERNPRKEESKNETLTDSGFVPQPS